MPYNGNGTFVRIYNWQVDRNNGVKIRADRMDAEMDGFATGLSTAITRDGQSPATANLPMGGFKHTNVADGTARDQYATVGQVQDGDNTWGGTSTGAGNLYQVGLSPATTAYAPNATIRFLADKTNTAAATMTVDGLATKDIRKGFNQSPLSAGDIRAGQLVEVTYDGTYQILKELAGGGSSGLIDYILF